MRGLSNAQRLLLARASNLDASAAEVLITIEDARDLVSRGLAEPSVEGEGWHDVDLARARFALRVDAAARAAGVWP